MKNTVFSMRKKYTLKLVVLLAIVFVFFGSGCNTISPKLQDEYIRPGLSQGMYDVFDKYRQLFPENMPKCKVPGLSLALVDRDGILWAVGFGFTDYDKKTPVTPNTLFDINSTSKTITATAVMIAVQEGLVELDVPIVEYWPEFTVNSRFEENPENKITLRHLLSHTSGIAYEAPIGNNREPSYLSFEENVRSISDTWLRYKVGERYSYSSPGYALAAYVLQLRSGQPFAEYLEDKVFIPLNMPNCSADPQFIINHPNRAVGHAHFVKHCPLAWDVPFVGCGGQYANAKELANFVQFFLNGGKVDGQTVLDERLVTTMITPSIRNKQYGLGVEILPNKYCVLSHGGRGMGFQSYMFWFPEYGIGGVYLINSMDFKGSFEHSFGILTDLIDENLVPKNESFEIPSVEHQAYRPLDPNTFTPFKPAWEKYIGTYKFFISGWKPGILMRIALGLGLTTNYSHLRVFENDGYLYVDTAVGQDDDGGRLDEHLPGLFFTPSGKCLDLRGPTFTWQNYRMKKVDNKSDRKFNINF